MSRGSPFIALLLLVLLAGGAGGCAGQAEPIRPVSVHTEDSQARKESLAEQRFLVRLSGAVPRFRDTESYGEFCRLWNECLHDHLARFPESAS